MAMLTPGNANDITVASTMPHRAIAQRQLRTLASSPSMPEAIIVDRAYDADWLLEAFADTGIDLVIPPRRHRREQRVINLARYRNRNQVERFFNRIKQCRRVATRYEKTARNFLCMILIAAQLIN